MIKKLVKKAGLFLAVLSLGLLIGGCSEKNANQSTVISENQSSGNVESHDVIEAKAKAEGTVVVYSITSRIANAAKGFEKKYGIKVEASDLKDFELIDKITTEVQSGAPSADFVICQDSGRIWGELLKGGYVYNYVPENFKNIIPLDRQDPLVFTYMNKVFCYNSETSAVEPITNIWELTEPQWRRKFFIKSPLQEGINANFLTMLTSPENSAKLEQAYEDRYHEKLKLTTPNAGYEWMKRVFENGVVMGTSDTTMTEAIGVRGHNISSIGLLNYSKLRYAKSKNLAVQAMTSVQPVCGFYYPEYALLVKGAKHPYAAKLFIEYLLTQEGFSPWKNDLGTYSSNPTIPPAKGDKTIEEWSKIMINEDPQFIFDHRADVEDFLSGIL